ncbi:NAD(P)-dependent oxidoreductase [Nocardioides sp. MH1]|uniref:NAD(P)-dependent oxidoreductase n=1 Tax=Nocardioides sp. MH1 TaxID=3242490 RepID=UPI0035203D3B
MTEPIVALLGTGTMGIGMARNIAAAGLDLRVWNRHRDRAEPLADVATVAGSAAAAVDGADVVITMLYDAASVLDVMGEVRDALRPGAVWLQQSTIGVDGTAQAARLADELGVVLVDAPVLGTKQPAMDGALVVLASGPDEVRPKVAPVLDAIGSRTMWVGPAGAGTRLKLVANHWVFTVLEGVAESLALARHLDLDPSLFLEAVKGGALDAPYVQLKGRAMLDGALDPAFALGGAHKDSELILEAARSAGFDADLLAVISTHLARGVEAGHGDLDMAATYLTH